jgi:hypothetical protein
LPERRRLLVAAARFALLPDASIIDHGAISICAKPVSTIFALIRASPFL